MGSCYSRKANAEKYTYSSSQMASTKLDETSRLARPTPYTRNLSLGSTNSFGLKKSIPAATKYDHSSPILNSNEINEVQIPKNTAPQLQSSIPRYTSSIPSISLDESGPNTCGSFDNNCNKNDDLELHVVNNNDTSTSLSADAPSVAYSSIPAKDFNKFSDLKKEKISPGSKSFPDNISSHIKIEDKNIASRIPAKFNVHITGLPRPQLPQYVSKTAHGIPHYNVDNQVSKIHSSSYDKLNAEKKIFNVDVLSADCQNDSDIILTSHITSSGDSHDSITDNDSGLGNSLIEKNKQEDADTLKDLDHLEVCGGSPVNANAPEEQESSLHNKVLNGIRDMKIEDKISLRSPMYKREPNGKWIVDDKHFDIMQKYIKMGNEKNSKSDSPSYYSGNKTLHKLNYGEHAFSTYASYKGLVSYKKQSPFKYFETQNSLKGKYEKCGQSYYSNVSNIPVVRRPKNIDSSYSKGTFNTSINGSQRSMHNIKMAQKSSCKMEFLSESKQSSPESDDKSDSLGNGIGSPISELENREFLIDDEIADQPGLISFESSKIVSSMIPSLQQTVTELHALQAVNSAKKRSDSVGSYSSRLLRDRSATENRDSLVLSSEMGSSCSSIASDDLMLDYERTFDNISDGTANEGSPRLFHKQTIEMDDLEDKIFPLKCDRKSNVDYEEKNKKWLYRRSSGPFYGGSSASSQSGKMDWRLRSVSLPLRPPRQMIVKEDEDGSVKLDSSSYRLLCQDLNGVKTLLFRLKTVLQEAETLNPFDQANPTNIFYHNLAHSDFPSESVLLPGGKEGEGESHTTLVLTQENIDLRRQLVLLQQQLEEKDHTIHLLQQQMTKYTNLHGTEQGNVCSTNAATQTERGRSLTGSLTNSLSTDDSSETLVSVQDAFEEHFSETFKEQDKFTHQMEEITRSLSNLNQNLRVTASRHLCLQNRSFSSFELSCYRNSP